MIQATTGAKADVHGEIPDTDLLLLGTTPASLLGSLNRLLIALDGTALEPAHESRGSLERTLEVTGGGLAEEVDLGHVVLEGALEGDDALDEEGVGVVEVEVHDAHHGDTHQLRPHHGLDLREIVGVDGGGNKLALLGRTHRRRLDVFQGGQVYSREIMSVLVNQFTLRRSGGRDEGRTLLLVHNGLDVEGDANDDQVAENVGGAAHVEDIWVIERDLLGYLHHTQDDEEVRAVGANDTCQ
jgi:hypothetical protein